MEWQFLVVLMVAIPLILLPAAFVWYMNAGGMFEALRGRWARRAKRPKSGQDREGVTKGDAGPSRIYDRR